MKRHWIEECQIRKEVWFDACGQMNWKTDCCIFTASKKEWISLEVEQGRKIFWKWKSTYVTGMFQSFH